MTIHIIHLRFSVCIIKVLLEGSVSRILYLGPSFHFMAKNGQLVVLFAKQFSTFHKMKTRT